MWEVGDGPVVVDGVATNRVTKMVVPAPLRLDTLWSRETRVWRKLGPHTTSLVLREKEQVSVSGRKWGEEVCVCVCVCVREREREGKRGKERERARKGEWCVCVWGGGGG